ncbi:hypothetical protein G6F63_015950 [Rhizopus arrhizus]|nr:hypothetical protein G6F63_015950 [Rhizopus arrhizus]
MQGVEEVAADLHAGRAQRRGQDRGQAVGAAGDAGQAVRAVVDGVHRRHHRQQHLRGADVGGSGDRPGCPAHPPRRRSGGPASNACRHHGRP